MIGKNKKLKLNHSLLIKKSYQKLAKIYSKKFKIEYRESVRHSIEFRFKKYYHIPIKNKLKKIRYYNLYKLGTPIYREYIKDLVFNKKDIKQVIAKCPKFSLTMEKY